MRACSQAASQSMLLVAFSLMPLGGATAIMFSSPIFATLASAYFLHEKVGPTRWTVLLVGFLGVLVIASPGADSFQIGALFALGNAVLFGTVVAGVRGMTTTELTATLIMYQLTLLTAAYGLTFRSASSMPSGFDAGIMLVSGLGNAIGAILVDTRDPPGADIGGRAVPVSPAGLGDLLGFAIWGDLPTAGLLIGSAIVIASGMYRSGASAGTPGAAPPRRFSSTITAPARARRRSRAPPQHTSQ